MMGGEQVISLRDLSIMTSRTLEPLLQVLQQCCASLSDADLLDRFARMHDQEAFAALVQRHGPMVLAVCRRLLPDRHEAEDAFQATFLVLVRRSAGMRQPRLLAGWLHGVALRVALRLRRVGARRTSLPENFPVEAQVVDPLERLAWQEIRAILDEEIEQLPSKYRLPVVLCYLQGQTYTEAARSLGCPAGTVSVRLARARQKLRDRFVRRGLALSASLSFGLLAQEAVASSVPARLATATVNAGVCTVAAPALAGFSQQVIALAEGAIRTMWLTKIKAAFIGVLAASMVCASLGGLVWHQSGQVRAQVPAPVVRPPLPDKNQDAATLEKQLADLHLQIQQKQRQLAKLRQGDALDQIEAAIKKLHQANTDDPKRLAAVQEFTAAFGKLKQMLAANAFDAREMARSRFAERANLNLDSGGYGTLIPSEGRVLQVDLEKKVVLLSSGSNEGIKKGQLYRVYQSGKMSPDQTGWIRVTDVNAKWSVASILQEFGPRAPMKANDFIQIHDGKEPKGLEGENKP
jgi:RNA polymerase sigma factor (sigma-70 family)